MAIYHLTTKVFSRGKGQSAVAAAAYRSGERLRDEATGEQKFYTARANRIEFTGLFLPPDAPEWARDRNSFWNRAEQAETRKDGRLAREIEVSLPHELTAEQRRHLVQDFVREAFVRKGYAADVAIHAPDPTSDQRNYHAHILISERKLGPDGFAGLKDRDMNSKAQLGQWREHWANLANRHLARFGHTARIDHRTLDAQGVDREATVHVGYAGMEITQRGGRSDRMGALQDVLSRNGERIELRRDQAAIEAELTEMARLQERQRAAATRAMAEARTLSEGAARTAPLPSVEPRNHPTIEGRAPSPASGFLRSNLLAEGLHVLDTSTGAVSRLGDFVLNLMAGPRPRAEDRLPAYSRDPAERAAQRHPRTAAQREAEQAGQALLRIHEDIEAGRHLRSEDIRSLTREHHEQIKTSGDDALRQMAEDVRRRDEGRWRGHERERER